MNRSQMLAVFELQCASDLKVIMLLLAFHADEGGHAWPRISRIESVTGLSRRTVQRKLRILVESRLLEIKARTAEGGRQTSNLYRVLPFDTHVGVIKRCAFDNRANLSPSRVTIKASPLEVTKEDKPSGVSSGGGVGRKYLQLLHTKVRGRAPGSMDADGGVDND